MTFAEQLQQQREQVERRLVAVDVERVMRDEFPSFSSPDGPDDYTNESYAREACAVANMENCDE